MLPVEVFASGREKCKVSISVTQEAFIKIMKARLASAG